MFISTYVQVNNDTDFLTSAVPLALQHNQSVVVSDYLVKVGQLFYYPVVGPVNYVGRMQLASAWKGFPVSPVSKYLVDYGSNKRMFLEVVRT
jgi:hypothetical protein